MTPAVYWERVSPRWSHVLYLKGMEPLAICPFCQSDADWPLDIVVVTLRRAASMPPAGARLTVTGRLGLGGWTDPETGFVSQIRITDAQLARA